jgi:membrane protein implicated in regulation of membrane protease activity
MTWLWAAVAFLALLLELHANSFHAIHEAVAAALVALLALVWPSIPGQILVFGLLSWFLLSVVRPRVMQRLMRVRPRPTLQFWDIAEREAVVLERVTDHAGLVEVGRGEFWSARAYPPGSVFEPGARVVVAYRAGIRLFVERQGTGS